MADSTIVELAGVTKRFGKMMAVDGISLKVERGEFCTLLGPSGCGKTTLLRMIAGFEFPDEGDIRISGRSCLDQPAHRRNLAMVFQGYALFPHRTVLQNVMFGLRMRKMGSPAEITGWARAALGMVGLEGFEQRHPQQLSGGQQQRVALARALVLKPQVLLLDEPLGALDLKLRQAMRYELKHLQRTTGITTIYVTHDQEEAMSMSDKVVVLDRGHIEQIDSPEEIYRAPRTAFVGDFVGESNALRAAVAEILSDGRLRLRIDGMEGTAMARLAGGGKVVRPGDAVVLLVRAERMQLAERADGAAEGFTGEIVERAFLGASSRMYVKADGGDKLVIADIVGAPPAWTDLSRAVRFSWAPDDGLAYPSDEAAHLPGERLR